MKAKTLLGMLAALALFAAHASAQVNVTTVTTNGLAEPYNVALDADNNFYIVDSVYNCIVRVDANTQAATILAGTGISGSGGQGTNDGPAYLAKFHSPKGLLMVSINSTNPLPANMIDSLVVTNAVTLGVTNYFTNYLANGLVVADTGNSLIRYVRLSDGWVTRLAGQGIAGSAINAAGASARFWYPVGLTSDNLGNVYVADTGNDTIRVMNLNDPAFGVTNVVVSGTTFYQPNGITFVGPNQLWVADTGDNAVKLVTLTSTTTGSLTTYMGSDNPGDLGTNNANFGADARFASPRGLLWVDGAGLLIADTDNNSIRLATNYSKTGYGLTNYAVNTYAGMPGQSGLLDGPAATAKFNSPNGMAFDVMGNAFLVADRANHALRRIQIGPPLQAVAAPKIGWVDYVFDPSRGYISILRIGSYFVFNNDVTIAILPGETSVETFFTSGPTPSNPLVDTIPNPSRTTGNTPIAYEDGTLLGQVGPTIVLPQPDVTVKAISVQDRRQNSPIAVTEFQFRTANPIIGGNNAAYFTVTDQTTNATMYYTIDGTDPTNVATRIQVPTVGALSLDASGSALTFKVRAFKDNYQDSSTVTVIFSPTNFAPNRISFGFEGGQEASSAFQASAGQFFYAPVTLSIIPNVLMYSLQFNVTVTNGVTVTDPNFIPGPAVPGGAVGFQSFLEKPDPRFPGVYIRIPPAMFLAPPWDPEPTPPPPGGSIFTDPNGYSGWFEDLRFTNSTLNLIGVAWLERKWALGTNLYNSMAQDLIAYSQPHDTLFVESGGKVVLGGYAFHIPTNAVVGQTYQIQIGLPSATSDGVGAPGSSVFIDAPDTLTARTNSAINAIKYVTIRPQTYIAGDCAPFRWFNAGDFGDGILRNDDVEQVFQTAIYGLNPPPEGSDFFDSMDSCCGTYVDLGHGYLEQNTTITDINALEALFNGNDTTINQIAFGDGTLDVCDIFVTLRRAVDTSLSRFSRFWTNGVLVAVDPMPSKAKAQAALPKASGVFLTNPPSVNFAGADCLATAGQIISIPITAQIHGTYPLRLLMLSLSVEPLDGSPPLTSQVQFTPNPVLGQPYYYLFRSAGNYSAIWLDQTISGLTNNATLGTLTVQIPANATSSAAYAIHFDHASASPNGLAPFPKTVLTGLITLSDRSASSFNDGIPDSWRLRHFGTLNNLLSLASADADGDGMNNWQEYVAGTDPMDPKSCLRLASDLLAPTNQIIHWPSVVNKTYVVESATTLYGPDWIPVSTNSGTGYDVEYHDPNPGAGSRFYRVRVLP